MKRYIITTVVPGAKPFTKFLEAIKTYTEFNRNSEIVFIPSIKIYQEDVLHPIFQESPNLLQKDKNLNKNIKISLLPINPEAIDPITGLERNTQLEGSVIYASPKQRMKSVASPKSDLPRVVMTTGACTKPYYRDSKRGIMASSDHVNGAIIVEVESDSIYHFRQIQANLDGSFSDLGYKYLPGGTRRKMPLEALIPGDYHAGYTDPKVKNVIFELINKLVPKYLILHDFFDGISVNHHIEEKLLEKAIMGDLNDLEKELKLAAKELQELANKANNVIIVRSNHDEFLDRWLSEGKYLNDNRNHIIGLELALAKAKGHIPLEYAINKYSKLNNVKFLKHDESFKLTPKKIECGVHGHRGPNGSRGSITGLEKSYGNIIYGHAHSPEILRGAFVVGTSTYLTLNYNVGPSSWLQTLCLLYADGTRQLINVIQGKYKI